MAPLNLIPKHSPALRRADFVPYFRAPWRSRTREDAPQRADRLASVWTDHLPGKACLGTPAGRHALWYFLEAAQIPKSGKVIVAAYNYYVVVRLLVQWGLTPVFVDVDPETLTMDPAALDQAMTEQARTNRATTDACVLVLVTHMFGHPADMAQLTAICNRYGVPLFEDCAHGVGTRDNLGQIGNQGRGALFSFGPQKLMSCFGGGMLAVDRDVVADYAPAPHPRGGPVVASSTFLKLLLTAAMSHRSYRVLLSPVTRTAVGLARLGVRWPRDLIAPSKDDGSFVFSLDSRPAYKNFMTEMSALQLGRLDENIARRRAVIAGVKAAVGQTPHVRFLNEDKFGFHNGAYFGVRVQDKELFARLMRAHGVEVNPHEFFDCSRLEQFAGFAAACPHARTVCDQVVRLPSFPTLDDRDRARIAAGILAYCAARDRGDEGELRC